jgi:serine phosphatase RsbU (regulator of sigma subunit)
MNRRRSHLEMLACALLVAVLAVQPAIGDPGHKGNAAPAPAATKSKRAKPASALATAKVAKRAGRARARVRVAQIHDIPAQPPTAAPEPDTPLPSDPAVPPAPVETVDPVAGAPAEQGDPGTPPATPAAPAEAPAPAPATFAPDESLEPRDPNQAASPAARGAAGGAAVQAPATDDETPRTGDLAVAPASATPSDDPDTREPAGGAVAVPAPGAPSTQPPSGGAGGSATGGPRSPLASPVAAPSRLTQTAAKLPRSAIESPLVTQAGEAITRVRPGGASETSGPRPRPGDDVPSLHGTASSGASNTSVSAVLVSWAKYALAGLILLVLVLGVNAVLAAARTRRLERQRERLMEDIGLLQSALLPAVPARLGSLLTTVAYRPADGPAAGGDFYDAFALPDGRVGLLLGDVSGHGRQALAKTTLVRFTVRAHLEAGLSPREAIAIAGRSLDGRLSDDFATVIAAIHDPAKGTLTYASAGHPPPIVLGPSRHRPVTVSSSPPIGAGFPTGQRQTVLPMPEGTTVMIYSDGLLEARVDGVALGAERLAAWLDELAPEATAKAILDRVVSHADRVPDDLAAVVLHASPGATAPASRIEQLKLDVLDMDGPDLDGFLRAAGVADVDRLIAGRRVSELLAVTSGVIVEVRTGEHAMVSVAPIGEDTALSTRQSARAR